jgi:hypothetical protein
MRESQVVLKWKAEGRAEGKLEVQVEVLRDSLLRALQVRFQTPIPAELEAAVKASSDPDELTHWFDVALTASSLDEFRATIQR